MGWFKIESDMTYLHVIRDTLIQNQAILADVRALLVDIRALQMQPKGVAVELGGHQHNDEESQLSETGKNSAGQEVALKLFKKITKIK